MPLNNKKSVYIIIHKTGSITLIIMLLRVINLGSNIHVYICIFILAQHISGCLLLFGYSVWIFTFKSTD